MYVAHKSCGETAELEAKENRAEFFSTEYVYPAKYVLPTWSVKALTWLLWALVAAIRARAASCLAECSSEVAWDVHDTTRGQRDERTRGTHCHWTSYTESGGEPAFVKIEDRLAGNNIIPMPTQAISRIDILLSRRPCSCA